MSSQQKKISIVVSRNTLVIALLALALLAGGGFAVMKPGAVCQFIGCRNPNPGSVSTPYTAPPYHPFTVLDVAIDGPPWYPAQLAHLAALAIASQIDADTRENSGGMLVYVHFVSSHSYHDDYLSFSIPAIAAFPLMPTQPVCGPDPYKCKKLQDAYALAYVNWQQAIKDRESELAAIREKVRKETDIIRAMPPHVDNRGSDIFGAMLESSQHVQNAPAHARKILVIASDLQSTTTLQETGPFSLKNVTIQVAFQNCVSTPAICDSNNNYWRHLLLSFGAVSVTFSDPQESTAQGIVF